LVLCEMKQESTADAVEPKASQPAVIASFSEYAPPFDHAPIVERMLDSIPPNYLIGLDRVVLTDSAGLPRARRRAVTKSRKRKVKIATALGLYHQEWEGERAWIEIFVDNTLRNWEKGWWLKLSFMREGLIGDVLFHEIGHHIHYTSRPEHREKEDVADVWKVRLWRDYSSKRHALLNSVLYPLKPLIRFLHHRGHEKGLKAGRISRAEFEEESKGWKQ
jgi:hypothetical protein